MEVINVSAENFRRQLADLLNRAGYGDDQIIIERYGAPIAVLMSYKFYQNLHLDPDDVGLHMPQSDQEKNQPMYMPSEQVPALAADMTAAREEAGIPYQTLAEGLMAERLRTLRQKYPRFAEEHVPAESA